MIAGGIGIILKTDFAEIVLPHPASPIKPTFSPGKIFKFIPSKTLSKPSYVLNCKCRSLISNNGNFNNYTSLTANISRIPSPKRLNPNTINTIPNAGNIAIHQKSGKYLAPSATIVPKSAVGG